MVFVGIFMMPFYYGSKARSRPRVPEDALRREDAGLQRRLLRHHDALLVGDLHARHGGAAARLLLGWNYNVSIAVSAVIVLLYIFLGGLTSAIYNEVLQFFLIVAGFVPLVFLGLRDVGGWSGLTARLATTAQQAGFAPGAFTHSWKYMGSASANPMGVEWFGLVAGLGFVLSFGYWCTDFLVIQRAMAADSMSAARRTPLIASLPKMLFPFLVILPGMIAIALTSHSGTTGFSLPLKPDGTYNYDMAIPPCSGTTSRRGSWGSGLTALMASFMSGMAGNVTAFNTVWTYDMYQSYIHQGRQRPALPVDGPLRHGLRHRPLGRHGVHGDASSTTSWTCSSWCSRS